MFNFIDLIKYDSWANTNDIINHSRRVVISQVINKPNILQALRQVNFRYHRTCSFYHLPREHKEAREQTLLIFWGVKNFESKLTIGMSQSSSTSLQTASEVPVSTTPPEKEICSTAQQTDISCRYSPGILPSGNDDRLNAAQLANSLTFSSPPSSVLQPNRRSVSILNSVCALLLTKQGSTTKGGLDTSGSHNSFNICRICFGGESAERLVRPCSCRGTIAAVHRACLERWLLQASTSYCELCRHHYVVTRSHKWSFPRSVWEWARSGRGRALLADAWRGAALGAGSVLGTARALHLADVALQAGARRGGGAALAANLFSSVLIGIIGALNGLLTTWILLKIQEHQASWRAWRDSTVHVHVALDEPTPTPSAGSFTTVVGDSLETMVDRSTNIADPFMVSLPYTLPEP